jgi:hypothetical protein
MGPAGKASPVRLRSVGRVPVWLSIVCGTYLDDRGFLTVSSSVYTVSAGEPDDELFHYDYERDKDDYPDAHVQVHATSPVWDRLFEASGMSGGSLHKLHLPVGGRRYRPALEDVIETLIVEGIVAPRGDWRKIIDAGREEFRERQLKAAVSRRPDIAVQVLRAADYKVEEPKVGVVDFVARRLRRSN